MNDQAGDPPVERSSLARAGITALNLITPGLGLLRIGKWRTGLSFLLAPFALLALLAVGMGHFPITSHGAALIALFVFLGLMAALYIVPAVLTWRGSRQLYSASRWSRWYALIAMAIVQQFLLQLEVSLAHSFYKPFYSPSESMTPTIGKGDRYVVDMRWRGPFGRGDIIVFNGPDGGRISRIAAIPGDRIAMRGGVPILNGKPVVQSLQGQVPFADFNGSRLATILRERLPDEASTHRVLDTGPSEFDDTQEVTVPPNHLFVLGDNRDHAADSRVPPEFSGVGMVPFAAVLGRPMYIHWSGDRSRIGVRLDR